MTATTYVVSVSTRAVSSGFVVDAPAGDGVRSLVPIAGTVDDW